MTNLIKEFSKYKYKKVKNCADTSDHMADALRYAFLSIPSYKRKFYKSPQFWITLAISTVIFSIIGILIFR